MRTAQKHNTGTAGRFFSVGIPTPSPPLITWLPRTTGKAHRGNICLPRVPGRLLGTALEGYRNVPVVRPRCCFGTENIARGLSCSPDRVGQCFAHILR